MRIHRKLVPWLIAAGAAELALAVVQWLELESLRGGGEAPFCAISTYLSCQTVWLSPMARAVSELTRMPVAGLGVVWGLVAAFLGLMAWARVRTSEPAGGVLAGIRIVAAAGVLSVLAFIGGSVQAGAVCLTCLGTYALVGTHGVLALLVAERRMPSTRDLGAGMAWAGVALLVASAAVLWQARALGSSRPSATEEILRLSILAPPEKVASAPDEALAAVLGALPPEERQLISFARARYRASPPLAYAREPRHRWGPADAPVRLVEWTDIRCPHCRDLLAALSVLKRVLPPGRLSVESRQYPLDSECNHGLQGSDRTGLRCLGARVQICLEGTPEQDALVSRLFAAQESLSKEKILDIASSGSLGREALERCVQSPETERKLQEDIAYAEHFQPRGTPAVLMNGRYVEAPFPTFLYVMALAGGRTDLPAFDVLPPPPVP